MPMMRHFRSVRREVQVDEFEKTFDYTFNTTLQKWVFDYQPS